ncbi:alpha/beta fold hydrolase [Methylobacterium sp. J-092]|uniref:alpha/beta fold hydrolase n=1 Tax=Methylobacterium sp. J-092 TaxID=2836667 RepID=UPI001FBAD3FF|nr:alpha/beta fold hydrolase [Methylobacterium sp. J-092]MCJ2007546.1 alpha/beta fold hydrolase [Methylobacterium sp. J-092]
MTYPPHPAVTRDTILCEGRPVTIERFAPRGKDAPATATVILLHDAEGPGPDRPVRAEAAALAEAGFAVLLPHYLERTGEARVGFSGISRHFGAWRDALEIVRAQVPGPAALVGRSLGGALALALAARAPEAIAALVLRSAFLPPELGSGPSAGPLALPPVLALHGARDALVGRRHPEDLHRRMAEAGGSCRVHLYEDQGHAFDPRTDADAVARGIAFLKRGFGPI